MNTAPVLLPPDADSIASTGLWLDPNGCITVNNSSSSEDDCPACPPDQTACAHQRSFSPPPGSPLAASIAVDDSKTGIVYKAGTQYTDCIQFTHGAPSGGGCRPADARPCTDCVQYGQSVSIAATRTFARSIASLKVYLQPNPLHDDIGYFGVTQLNDCCKVFVTFPLDVTDQVAVSGAVASFVMRAADVACSNNYFNFNLKFNFVLQ